MEAVSFLFIGPRASMLMLMCCLCRVSYSNGGVGAVSQQLYSVLTRLQMGLIEDEMGWTVELS